MKHQATKAPRSIALGQVDYALLDLVPAYQRKGVTVEEIGQTIKVRRPQAAVALAG
ncbi:hypothetical protein [Pseudomonas sp. DC3000-4b1]|uniref:hypothetical protein n=1 Tax=unclassified Pseudomonas TaxID=196821 RepID=UPI003CF15E26